MYKRLLVPIDGSETGQRGLKEAIALAVEQQATLCLVHVTGDFPFVGEMAGGVDVSSYRDGLHAFGLGVLETAKALARSAGLQVETQLLDLNGRRVADAILKAAASTSSDLIVIGTHGRRGIGRVLLGSDAENVLRASPVPVLLVRAVAGAQASA